MTQGTRKQTTEPILGTPILEMAIIGTPFPWCVRLSSNKPGFVSVDLIWENNQVIIESRIPYVAWTFFRYFKNGYMYMLVVHARTIVLSTYLLVWSYQLGRV